MMAEEDFALMISELEIVNKDGVYGNIYLPSEIDGHPVSWKSSHPEVISDQEIDGKKPGIVTRGNEEIKVTMTATVEKDGLYGVHSQEVTVKALERRLTEDDYEGYLFSHFIGEGQKGQEQMYFALAEEGLKFVDMNNKQPVLTNTVGELGVRDPYIYRSPEGDSFFIVATNLSIYERGGWGNARGQSASRDGSHALIFWESHDLVNWSESKEIYVAPSDAGMAWAPEMIYDEKTGDYAIYFASSLVNEERTAKTKPDAIYYVTTRDFVHFSEPQLLIDNQIDSEGQDPRIAIDATIINIDGTYYAAFKDGDNNVQGGGIRILKSDNLLDKDGWTKHLDLDELGLTLPTSGGKGGNSLTNMTLEGPEFFILNKGDRANPDVIEYGLMADQYMANAGYIPLSTTNILDTTNAESSWKILSNQEYSFAGLTKRHGAILRLTKDEIERIKTAYPNT